MAQSTMPPSPLEISQQLQRVDALHAQLKAETVRAQEFLLKLRREEYDAPNQAQLKLNGRTIHQEAMQHQKSLPKEQKQRDRLERQGVAERKLYDADRKVTHSHNGLHTANHNHTAGDTGTIPHPTEPLCKCSCPHHPPLSPASEAQLRKTAETNGLPLPLHTHVDEREVRDLEKRVRGLEGRVRGFEGLPPDREMALMEVERLRRELEGLARRREGVFEGLGGDLLENGAPKKGAKAVNGGGKAAGNGQGNGKAVSNGKTVGNGKR